MKTPKLKTLSLTHATLHKKIQKKKPYQKYEPPQNKQYKPKNEKPCHKYRLTSIKQTNKHPLN